MHGGHSVRLQLAGTHGLPPSGIAAVVLNLTVTHTTTSGHLMAYPDGSSRPGTSCLNYPPGWTGANLLTAPVSDTSAIDLYVSAGTVDLIGDVEGWYASAPTVPASYGPGRAFDPTPRPGSWTPATSTASTSPWPPVSPATSSSSSRPRTRTSTGSS